MRKHYHENTFPSSDTDLFLYGLTPQEVGRSHFRITLFVDTILEG